MTPDLRLGDYRTALDGETWDALIVDAPYSAKTHTGYNDGTISANRVRDQLERMKRRQAAGLPPSRKVGGKYTPEARLKNVASDAARAERKGEHRRLLTYAAWSPADVQAFVAWAAPRTRGWMVSITDDVLWPVWRDAMEAEGRYAFSPVVWYAPGSRVRMTGDGPANWTCWLAVSRPRSTAYSRWGSLPGGYLTSGNAGSRAEDAKLAGAKPLDLMTQIVADYSRPGDLVCDPCAGGGTTLLAALRGGVDTRTGMPIGARCAIGAEIDPDTHAAAVARIQAALAMPLFDPPSQTALMMET